MARDDRHGVWFRQEAGREDWARLGEGRGGRAVQFAPTLGAKKPMRFDAGVGLIALSLALCAGCSETPRIRLFNHSGGTIVLRYERETNTALAAEDVIVHLANGTATTFDAFRTKRRGLRLASPRCDYRYRLPTLDVVGWTSEDRAKDPKAKAYSRTVPVRVDPDFTLYLLGERGSESLPAARLKARQGHGFPLRPVSAICR